MANRGWEAAELREVQLSQFGHETLSSGHIRWEAERGHDDLVLGSRRTCGGSKKRVQGAVFLDSDRRGSLHPTGLTDCLEIKKPLPVAVTMQVTPFDAELQQNRPSVFDVPQGSLPPGIPGSPS